MAEPEISIKKSIRAPLLTALCIVLILGSLYVLLSRLNEAPEAFKVDTELPIEAGMNTKEIIQMLKNERYIRSTAFATMVLKMRYSEGYIQAGTYSFPHLLATTDLLDALVSGEYLLPPISVTFYEGVRGAQIEEILRSELAKSSEVFPSEMFDEHIGYLFPDTYHVSEEVTTEEMIALMRETFDKKTEPLAPAFAASELRFDEVITLASIIEREANTEESMRIVSGILHERLRIGMPLQVDATFEYLLGKSSSELTEEDLDIESPYNTYLYAGLPPTPIANPGIQAIEAALYPAETDYLYYLTGKDGAFHYARTFEEHKRNKELYLW